MDSHSRETDPFGLLPVRLTKLRIERDILGGSLCKGLPPPKPNPPFSHNRSPAGVVPEPMYCKSSRGSARLHLRCRNAPKLGVILAVTAL